MGRKKEILKEVMKEGGKGAAIGGAMGGLASASNPILQDAAKGVNPIDKYEAFNQLKELGGNKYLPLTTAIGLGSYKAGQEFYRQTEPLKKIKEKLKERKNKG